MCKAGKDPVEFHDIYFAEGKEETNGCMTHLDVLCLLAEHCAAMLAREDKIRKVAALA